MSFLSRSERRLAFTLVELLTVMAIIGMLAAIIIPAVSGSRERGRRAYCQNNLSQLGRGIMMFADENGERLPPVSLNVTESYWDRAVLPYIGNASNAMACLSDPLLSGSQALGNARTYAVNATPDWGYRVPFGRYGQPTTALRMSDLDFNKGDLILAGERVGTDLGNRGYIGWFNYCGLDFQRATLHRNGGNYLMASMAVRYMETNSPAFNIAEGNRGNLWTVYTAN